MPNVILGPVIFNSNEGIITGAALNVSPTSTSKTVAGAGGFNTGYWVVTNNWLSTTGTVDPDVADSNIQEVV
ncbi:spore germination protein [Bacillus pinisoli]|uniref:spore germination protein n=1 Tax=Bacillus pinisoli TaxID=2901866 RepID=UPI001FF6B216|nr:spore germination protein [Bacillus pinisoli]